MGLPGFMNRLHIVKSLWENERTGVGRPLQYAVPVLAERGFQSIWLRLPQGRAVFGLLRRREYPRYLLFNGFDCLLSTPRNLHWMALAAHLGIQTYLYSHETGWVVEHYRKVYPRQLEQMLAYLRRFPIHHLVTCQRAKDYVMHLVGVPSPRVSVVYNSVPDMANDARYAGLRLRPFEDKIVVAAVGSIQPRKGTDLFVEAALQVLKHTDDFRFIWAGEGYDSFWQDCVTRVRQAGAEAKIRFVGYQDPSYYLLNGADMVVVPSRDDPLPLAGLEAMSWSKTVVCFDVGGLPEALAGTGYVIPEVDASKLAEQILTLGRRGREGLRCPAARERYLSQFTPERFVERLLTILMPESVEANRDKSKSAGANGSS